MEVPENESKNPDCNMTSAAAFVDGGIQEACDDACSICLEEFCESDPSTVTSCKHEYHLQCILEWCQRSSQCPMCWQSISLKDPNSQELLEAVDRERNFRAAPPINRTIFHHPTLGDFELQHLPMGTNDSELEERIMQHLAAAAAMGRAHHIGRRDGQRSRSSAHGRQRLLVFSANSSTPPSESVSSSLTQIGEGTESAAVSAASPSSPLISHGDEPSWQIPRRASVRAIPSSLTSGSSVSQSNQRGTLNSLHDLHISGYSQSPPPHQDRAEPSELHSFSESLKSRFSAVSMRYKESFSRSTRGWKERLFSRNNSMSELGSEVRRELNAGIASVSRMMEGLETRENSITNETSESTRLGNSLSTEHINRNNGETPCHVDEGKAPASGATSSASSLSC